MIVYPRTALAVELVHQLRSKTAFDEANNSLFLTAPRRTGKTTFLRSDLCPALERDGVVVVYVDLWADATRDPSVLIADAIGRSLQPHLGQLTRAPMVAGRGMVSLTGQMDFEISRIGKLDEMTLVDALRALHKTAGKPVALVIDEAQHALTSEAGEAAMTALKSVRDQLNRPGVVNLMLVMSGSDRDMLLRMVTTSGSHFYGSPIKTMPVLGADFIAHIVKLIEAQRPELAPVDQATLQAAFEGFGNRPHFFAEALGQVLSPLSALTGRFEPAMLQAAALRLQDQMESDYLSLKPLEQAVLWRMLEQSSRFRPYDAEALHFYREKTGRHKAVTTPQAQNALESMRQRLPALVCKSARGEYTVEDAAMHRWYEARAEAGHWPPLNRQDKLLPNTE